MAGAPLAIVYTGGTLGMVRSPKGYVPAQGLAGLLAAKSPEIVEAYAFDVIEYDPPLDSANATPRHWYTLAETIAVEARDRNGIVVIHGTDTLAYTASALSFLLPDLAVPVVVTGAQIPLVEARNDARGNLLAALDIASRGEPAEVCVCFGPRLLRGNRTTKLRATALDAFASPNCPPLGHIGTTIRVEPLPLQRQWLASPSPGYRDCAVAVLPLIPGLSAGVIDGHVAAGVAGIILECYGVGTAPDRDSAFLAAIGRAVEAGILVLAISQCGEGSVALSTYAAGGALAEAGVVGGFDLTREAALTKMHVLFAHGLTAAEVARLMPENLCGELDRR
ncbi:MAG: asparaginase [Rhodospirillales bacterium]|nr:asparaginase [Rhodospirillales bacterium]